jgi:hypothetical protein
MNRTLVAVVSTVAVFAVFGVRQVWVKASPLKSTHVVPSVTLAETDPRNPLVLEKPLRVVTPPYHKPANMPGDWWRTHHPLAQNRGDFNTVECQECHKVETYCNRCHGYVGVKAVDQAASAKPLTSQRVSK